MEVIERVSAFLLGFGVRADSLEMALERSLEMPFFRKPNASFGVEGEWTPMALHARANACAHYV